jgi:peptide/nickel transport system permease protein
MADATATVTSTLARHASDAPGRVSNRQGLLSVLLHQRLALTGVAIVGFFIIVAIVGPYLAPYGATQQFSGQQLKDPGGDFRLGTDEFGRDVLSRLVHGARISFQVGVIAVGISAAIGIFLGLIAGYFRGWVDSIISLLMDVLFAFPTILLAIALMTALGNSLSNVMIAIGLVNAPSFMRVVRGSVLSVRNSTFVESAVVVGAPTRTILMRHIFPNITAPLVVHGSLNFAFAVLSEASLAFLGLGNKPPSPSWGSMVSASYPYLQQAPWAAVFPGLAIALTVLGFNLLGDGLRDAMDPKLRS